MSDALEEGLAIGFNPMYHVSAGEKSDVGFAEFNDEVPQTVRETYGSTPVRLKYRVRPLGIRAKPGTSIQYGFLQVDFLTLWNRDSGMPGPWTCYLPLGFFGYRIWEIFFDHRLDNEWSSMLVSAPAVLDQQSTPPAYQYNPNPFAYRSYFLRTAAHEDTWVDRSEVLQYEYGGLPLGYHTNLWLARNKHATYPRNPDGEPTIVVIFPLAVSVLDYLWERYGWSRFWYCVFYYLVYIFVFTCFHENFIDQGSEVGQYPTNVGELSNPADGMRYIQDTEGSPDLKATSSLGYKLSKDLWSWLTGYPGWVDPPLSAPSAPVK